MPRRDPVEDGGHGPLDGVISRFPRPDIRHGRSRRNQPANVVRPFYLEALERSGREDATSQRVAEWRRYLAWALDADGKSAEALPILSEIAKNNEKTLGPTGEFTLIAYRDLAHTLIHVGDFSQALNYARRTSTSTAGAQSAADPGMLRGQQMLAEALRRAGQTGSDSPTASAKTSSWHIPLAWGFIDERHGRHSDRAGLRRIGMQDSGQATHADSRAHDDRHFIDEFTGASGDNRRAENVVGPLPHVDLYEAVILSVGNRTINVLHHDGEGLYRNGLRPRFACMHANVCDLGVAIGTPGNRRLILPLHAGAERVLDRQ